MTGTGAFAAWDRDSERYEEFAEAAHRLLEDDPELRRAHATWADFFVESHGDVFEQVDLPDPRERVFVDALYYDFVVDRVLSAAEETFGFEVTNRGHDADALGVDFGALHQRVVETASLSDPFADDATGDGDLTREALLDADVGALRDLYESVVSREVRLALGQYYTPRGVAELAVETLDVTDPGETFLDPGCGSGAFLAVAIDEKREALAGGASTVETSADETSAGERSQHERSPADVVELVTDTVFGVDLDPIAVKSAKLGYVLALLPELATADVDEVEIPVYLADALELTRDRGPPTEASVPVGSASGLPTDEQGTPAVDHLVGNPPWITWTDLTESVRAAWREVDAERLDLLPHDGAAARLGHGNDDVSLPFAWVCLDSYLNEGGDAAFVLKRDVMKGPAGKLLRTGRVGDRSVPVRFVHDFTDLRPFGAGVDAAAAVYALSADADPESPVPAVSWTRVSDAPDFSSAAAMRESLASEETGFVPVETDDPTSAWVRRDAERRALGECDHRVRHGLKDDAKAVFSVDRSDLGDLDADLVYPYLRSKHVVKYGLFGHDLHLVPMEKAGEDNEEELREEYPATYDYLTSHRERLEARASSWLDRGPFYTLFGLGEYTWTDYKVVWCRLGFKPHFAVVSAVEDPDLGGRTVVPGDHCMFVACDDEREAHFLTALLNSAPYQKTLRDLASEGKASLSKTVVSKLALPEYRGAPEHRRLADLSMEAHEIVPEHTDVSKREYNRTTIDELAVVQAEIDELVEELLAGRSLGTKREGE